VAWRLVVQTRESRAMVAQREARATAAPRVAVVEAQARDIVSVYEATGTLETPQDVKLAPKVTGRIVFLTVHEGDRIRKGQVLVRMDSDIVEANVRQARGILAEAEFRLSQAKTTQNANDVGVLSQLQQQQAAVATAQANYDQARSNYNSQVAAAQAAVNDAQGRIDSASGTIITAEAAIASAEANLEDATVHYNRLHELYTQGFVAAQDVDDAKATMKVMQATLNAAKAQLKVAQAGHSSATAQHRSADEQLGITRVTQSASIKTSEQALAQANAALKFATANLAQKPAYVQNLSALESTVASSRGALQAAIAQRQDTVLTAPMDGFVTARYLDPGNTATPGQPILGLQFFRQIWAAISVPPDISATLHLSQDARITFDTLPGRTFTGSIVQINPSADPQGRQFTVRATLTNADGALKPGMFAHVFVETARANQAVSVPREAVKQDAQGSYVMVIGSDNVAHRTTVTTGLSDPTYVALTEGVRAGDKVAVLSTVAIRDGQAVSPEALPPAGTVTTSPWGGAATPGKPPLPTAERQAN
jgi:RND family efflux transporter MFP subunit